MQAERKEAAKRKARRTRKTIFIIILISSATGGFFVYRKMKYEAQLARYRLMQHREIGFSASNAYAEAVKSLQDLQAEATTLKEQAFADSERVSGSVPEMLATLVAEATTIEPTTTTINTPPTAGTTNQNAAATQPSQPEPAAPETPKAQKTSNTNEKALVAAPKPTGTELPADAPPIHKDVVEVAISYAKIEDLASQVTTQTDAILVASNQLTRAMEDTTALPIAQKLIAITHSATQTVVKVKTELDVLKEHAASCAAKRKEFDDAEAIRIAAEQEVLRLQREREEAARKQREYEDKVANEIAQVDSARATFAEAIKAHDYESVDTDTRTMKRTIETPEGTAYLQVFIERIETLKEMKNIIINVLSKEGFPFGYGTGGSARDILKADERGIYVRGVVAPVKWSQLSVADTIRIVDFVLRTKGVRATDKMTIACGAAIYCDAFGERGRTKGDAYAKRAIELGMRSNLVDALRPDGW
jgi:hypothetical protein